MKPVKRLYGVKWDEKRRQAWERDGGLCQQCLKEGKPNASVPLGEAHIDHIVPLSKGGTNHIDNLRTLCYHHHVLRKDFAHRGMIANAIKKGVIPPDWRPLVWSDDG